MWLGFPRRSVVPFSGFGQAYGSERSAEFGMREMNQLTLQAESETSISYRRVSTVLIVVTAALLLLQRPCRGRFTMAVWPVR